MAASRKSAKEKRETPEQPTRTDSSRREVERTADGHYIVIDGRRWRATDPRIPEEERRLLVRELMKARRDVRQALREQNGEAEREARSRVNQAKTALGERGVKWWEDISGTSDEQHG